jgi:hypothetical protein
MEDSGEQHNVNILAGYGCAVILLIQVHSLNLVCPHRVRNQRTVGEVLSGDS